MKEIKLTQGKVALVDDEDFDRVNAFKWSAQKKRSGKFYAVRTVSGLNGKRHTVWMHRFIMNTPDGMDTDHIDNTNDLDNHSSNLRVCTRSENLMNQGVRSNSTSGFKGVSFNKRDKKWQVAISSNGRRISLGYYDTSLEAHKAYCDACVKHHGEFANFG